MQTAEAIRLYTQVIASVADSTALTDVLNCRARCYKRLADYNRAEADYDRALSTADDTLVRQRIIYNKTDLLIQTGRYKETITLLNSIRFADGASETKRIINMAVATAYLGDMVGALALLDSTMNRQTERDRQTDSYGTLLQNRAFIKWEQCDFEGAYADFCRALPLLNGASRYITLANTAVVEAELGRFAEALQHIDSVAAWQLASSVIGTANPDYIITLRKRAEILFKAGQTAEAVRAFKLFYHAEQNYINANLKNMTEQNRLDFWQKEKPLLSEIFAIGKQDAAFLYDVALFRRHLTFINSDATTVPSITAADVRHSLCQTDAAVEIVMYKSPAASDTVYAALVMTSKKTAFVPLGSKDDIHAMKYGGVRLDEAVCCGERYANIVYTDSALARRIWKPLLSVMPENVSMIYFAPDGIFNLLAIEYLPYKPLECVTLRRLSSTARIPKFRSAAARRVLPASDKALVVGGLSYNDKTISAEDTAMTDHTAYDFALSLRGEPLYFNYLRGTCSEADSIAGMMRCNSLTSANEGFMKLNMGRYDIIHLATHGYNLQIAVEKPPFFLRDSLCRDNSLLACGMAFTGANVAVRGGCTNDGLLSARELCELDLSRTELVTLSACQTAQGVVTDEGPVGIVRGLKRAGGWHGGRVSLVC